MKKSTITALLLIIAFNSYAQWSDKKTPEEPLVIHSSQGRIEIRNPSTCKQNRVGKGSIGITCENQCKQTTDSNDGKVLIQC